MGSFIGVELFKFRTQRALVVLLLVGIGMTIMGLAFLLLALRLDQAANVQLESASMQRQVLTGTGTSLVVLILSVLGLTSEFRHGTIGTTLRAVPARHKVVAAKALTYASIALGYGVVSAVLTQIGARTVLGIEGVELVVSGSDIVGGIAKNLLALVLWSLFAIGLAAMVANQVAALVIVLVEPFVSSLLGGFLPSVGKYLPSQAMNSFTATEQFAAAPLTPEAGLAVFVCYVIAALAAGIALLQRRDIG